MIFQEKSSCAVLFLQQYISRNRSVKSEFIKMVILSSSIPIIRGQKVEDLTLGGVGVFFFDRSGQLFQQLI